MSERIDMYGRRVLVDDEETKTEYLFTGLVGASPAQLGNVIERQEARGQAAFASSDTLPIDGTKPKRFWHYVERQPGETVSQSYFETMDEWMAHDDVAWFAEHGFELGPQVPGDEMFRYAKLPKDWKKVPSEHSMWTHIVDERGRERVSVFYKAAFYDRSAHCSVVNLEGPNGKVYADHEYVPPAEPLHPDDPRCAYKYGEVSWRTGEPENTCFAKVDFRWHHPESDVRNGDFK